MVLVAFKELFLGVVNLKPLYLILQCIIVQDIEFLRADHSISVSNVIESQELIDRMLIALSTVIVCKFSFTFLIADSNIAVLNFVQVNLYVIVGITSFKLWA